jgi:hypothetical protein
MACTSCNDLNRFDASCDTEIEGRMLNNMLVAPLEKADARLEGSVLSSKRTGTTIRKFHLRQQVCPFRTILASKQRRSS